MQMIVFACLFFCELELLWSIEVSFCVFKLKISNCFLNKKATELKLCIIILSFPKTATILQWNRYDNYCYCM